MLLDAPMPEVEQDVLTWQEMLLKLTGIDVLICPSCHKGKMLNERILQPMQPAPP
jgi:hypothetical protein